MEKIGIFGGSFDPPHYSHLWGVLGCIYHTDLDRVLVIPSGDHPWKSNEASYRSRVCMCERMLYHVDRLSARTSMIEENIDGFTYTVDVLSRLSNKNNELYFVCGEDVLSDMSEWKGSDNLTELLNGIKLLPRGINNASTNLDFCSIERIEYMDCMPTFSSTKIRKMLQDREDVTSMLPDKVHDFVLENNLYI